MKKLLSVMGSLMSIAGIVGIVFSTVLSQVFLSVIAALSGLFALAVQNQYQ